MSEKDYENKIKKYITHKGGWQVKFFANGFTKSGIPDILSCINGYFVGIEVKAKNGKPSQLQLYNQQKIRAANGICIILYPDQFEQFKEYIDLLLAPPDFSDVAILGVQYEFDRNPSHKSI